MVFESMVSDLLNRFIGNYVENLDKSQLKIGIWGGNVVLENLKVKENALSEFDVPFKVKAGQIGRLTLKIPWKNLYNDSVVASLEGLYLLVVPGATIKFDAEKEERYQQEAKQRELQRIEEALQNAARRASQTGDLLFGLENVVYKEPPNVTKGNKKNKKPKRGFKKLKGRDNKTDAPEEKKDSFMEKLATQVIKNLQVKISCIHLRYEDDLSDPERPLSMGVTLSELSLQTTDENWKSCVLNEAAKIIYKLGRLQCLCAYWNVNSPMFYKGSWENIVDHLKSGISSQDMELPHYQYIFKPIFASAKMILNPSAEQDLTSPKADLQLEVQNIALEMTRPQYLTMVEQLEAVDCMVKNAPYRRFRPEGPVHSNSRLWWRYGFNSILQVHVRRVSSMWCWANIRSHRERLKTYRSAYRARLSQGKASPENDRVIQDLEKVLDVFNITLARQQAQMEVIRSGQPVLGKKPAGGGQKAGGFFSSLFGRKTKKEEEPEQTDTQSSGLDVLITAEEKEKLYTAIGYSGSSHDLTLPKQYVAVAVSFQLCRTSLTFRERSDVPEILKVQMINLSTKISQRPGAQAFRIDTSLQQWKVTGLQQQGSLPCLMASVGDSSSSLLSVQFETNPENNPSDQLLKVQSQPVEIIYDSLTVNSLCEFFQTDKRLDLEVLTSATLSKLEEIKEKTATGLSHIIETRKVLDLQIDLQPSYLILPQSGFYCNDSHVIIVDFGSLQLSSVEQSETSPSSSLEQIMDRAYERFTVRLSRVQVLYSKTGEAWKEARLQSSSPQHILQPTDFTLQLAKCMVDKDARMARFKVSGELPLLHVKISDQKIQDVLQLVESIPLPALGSTPSTPTDKVMSLAESRLRPLLPPALLDAMETDSDDEDHMTSSQEELTDLHFKFEIREVLFELTRQAKQERTVLCLSVCELGAEGRKRGYSTAITSYLRRVTLDYCDNTDGGDRLHLIRSSEKNNSDLLKVEYIKADPAGPSFQSGFNNTEQTLKVEFSSLDFLLHTRALLSTINYLSSAAPRANATAKAEIGASSKLTERTTPSTATKGTKDGGVFSFKLFAVLGSFHVEVCDDRRSIADIRVTGIDASVAVQSRQTEVFTRLRDIVVTDANPHTVHRKAVSIVGEEVFSFRLSLFPGATEGDGYSDVAKHDGKITLRLGRIRIVYLHKFLMSLLTFVDNFQTAKAAVSLATAQAAEKAASSVRGYATKSFRLSLDVRLQAPLIILPQNSSSHNALVMDLGLITVGNRFSLLPVEGSTLPAVVDSMEVKLTQLKLARTTLDSDSSPDMEILQPINLQLLVKRNLSAAWFTSVPTVSVQGEITQLNMSLGEEDLGVLMKILVENIAEGSKEHDMDVSRQVDQERSSQQVEAVTSLLPGGSEASVQTNGELTENTVNVLLNFEIKEVVLTLKKPIVQTESPFLVFHLSQLGINTKLRKYDLCATSYIHKIALTCHEFTDSGGDPLCLISSSVESGAELLKVQYCKADRSGPNFSSVYKNTEQMINVTFSSLDLTLHTEALLSGINFLSAAMMSSDSAAATEKHVRHKMEDKTVSAKSAPSASSDSDIIGLKVMMSLGAFNVLVCDQSCSMAHLKIQGLNGSVLMQGSQTHISARLRDFIVLNVDPKSIHKKAISIVGDEVFSFSVSLTPQATEGEGYSDTEKTDGRVKLNVGCIQVVYLHRFVMALMNFSNNFQTAKAAVSLATAQAAEKAASSVRGYATKSFRLSLDVRLQAPLIILPQNSSSHNALVMDLGLITMGNRFSLLPVEGSTLPAVVDSMEVKLTQLKLARACLDSSSSIELLEPVNLSLNIRRNLAASWFHEMVPVEIQGDLKPMKVFLSQEDLKVLLRILTENVGEAEEPKTRGESLQGGGGANTGPAVRSPLLSGAEEEPLENMRFSFNIEALGLVLFNNHHTQPSDLIHHDNLRLGEFTLHLLKTTGKVLSDGSVAVSTVLTDCTLDDLRSGVERVTSRMVGCRDERHSPQPLVNQSGTEREVEPMVDVTYKQSGTEREVVLVLQKLFLCASVEFLMAVGDFFIKALPQTDANATANATANITANVSANTTTTRSDRLPLRHTETPAEHKTAVRTKLRAVVVDPEVVFVASLKSADAPALVASFQCDFSLQSEANGSTSMRANVRELKVLACPFIRNMDDKAVTTVLRPCSVALETSTQPNQPLSGSVTVEEVIVKISPFILNTVATITAAMTAGQPTNQSAAPPSVTSDLWAVMNIYGQNFWFLGVDQASEVTESFTDSQAANLGETFTAEVKVVQVTLESGVGHRTVPLLLAESSFTGSAKNWSSLLQLKANATLEVNYFNELHAVWEPLIERVESGRRRWTLELEVKSNPVQDQSPVHGDDFIFLPEAVTVVTLSSSDTLNVTVSQSSISVLQHLAKAFSEVTSLSYDVSLKERAPFTVVNCLGVPVMLRHSATLRPVAGSGTAGAHSANQGQILELGANESIDLEHAMSRMTSRGKLSALQRQESCLFNLTIVPSGYSEVSLPVDRPGRRLYTVRGAGLNQAESVLVQIDAANGNKIITIRSPLQIKNHFSVPFEVLRYCPSSRSLQPVGQAPPGRELHIALDTYRSQLFIRPSGSLAGHFAASSTCLSWKEQVHVSSEVRALLQCAANVSGLLPLTVSTLALPDELRHIASHGEQDWDPAYVIHLHPVATLRNMLPYTVRYMMESSSDSYDLPEGSLCDLLSARVSGEVISLSVLQYQGRAWSGHLRLEPNLPDFTCLSLGSEADADLSLELSVHVSRTASRVMLTLFSPYWIINRTSRVLQYRAENVSLKHPADLRDIVLFSFRKKALFSKSKLQLSVSTSSWSDGFSLDTVGSQGCVRCPANNMDYLVGVSIRMSSFNLTRVVTMSPFYTLSNKSEYELEVGEMTGQTEDNIRWHYLAAAEVAPLWPSLSSGKLCVRVVGSESASKFFCYDRQDNGTLLSLDMCGGIIVEVNQSDVSTVISFTDYYEGAAPALLLNHTPWATVTYTQSGSSVVHQLSPGEARRFVWDDPTGTRTLKWTCNREAGELDLLKDCVGQFSPDQLSQVHWVCFLDGRQRVLLFTEDVAVVTKARQAEELEQWNQEVRVSLQNLGLSLVNGPARQEVAYIGIRSSGVVWEMKPKNRWKPFSQKNINLLEKTFTKGETGWSKLETGLEVNLSPATMMMRAPLSCPIRRNFLSGIQVEFKQSPHQRSLRAQLHWLQIDNQLPGAIFPIVFHPVPPPKSIALDSEPKPFIDVSIITRFNQHSSVTQIKYFMALVQEMAVKVDQGFLGAVLALFTPTADTQTGQKSGLIAPDLERLQSDLTEDSLSDSTALSFFQHFHISPVKLHLSLSLGSGLDSDAAALQSVNLLLTSIGASLTDVDDLIFKLAFFEVKYQFYRRDKLMWAVVRHYSEQFLKQMYVLVLGLDVLGNPFGLIRGLSEGVEAFFYEPFQGAVQGPEEFAEGFVIGVRSLLGHTVGGAAGMVSRITGSVGKGLAAITMDTEYQQQRREEMNRTPKDFGGSLAKGGMGFFKGVVGGVTGIVTKPVEGAKKEGAAGFFKGIGKGLVGVVARPTGGIVDMASSTFQGIQRVAESTEEVTKLRPVRLIREDGIIRPYDITESEGFDLFQRSEIRQLEGEVFRDHCPYPGHRKTNIIVTNRRVFCMKEIDFVGHFNKEWECLFENFLRPPAVSGTELKIYCKEQQILKLPRSPEAARTVNLRDTHTAQKLHSSISSAQTSQQQRRMSRQKSQRFIKDKQ